MATLPANLGRENEGRRQPAGPAKRQEGWEGNGRKDGDGRTVEAWPSPV